MVTILRSEENGCHFTLPLTSAVATVVFQAHAANIDTVMIGGQVRKFRGKLVGVDLVADPDLALDPAVAARLLAYAFMLKGVPKATAEDDWVKVRQLIHGDLSGWKRFRGILIPLQKLLP